MLSEQQANEMEREARAVLEDPEHLGTEDTLASRILALAADLRKAREALEKVHNTAEATGWGSDVGVALRRSLIITTCLEALGQGGAEEELLDRAAQIEAEITAEGRHTEQERRGAHMLGVALRSALAQNEKA